MTIVTIKPAYLDRESTAAFVGLSERVMHTMITRDEFPKPRQLSSKRVGWRVAELEAWCDTRPVSAQLPPPNTGGHEAKAGAA